MFSSQLKSFFEFGKKIEFKVEFAALDKSSRCLLADASSTE